MSVNNARDPQIYVDADACPVKDETERVAQRHRLKIFMVSDGGVRPSQNPLIEIVIVTQGADAADDWIAEHIQKADICVTNDIPLAGRCLERDAFALRPNGQAFTHDSIGTALAQRQILQNLRDTGEITGGPRAFNKADRSQFLNHLETTVQAAKRKINSAQERTG
ncbi:MAG: YaiI/YqxD family protein [Alphaproteobacteria bacterium]